MVLVTCSISHQVACFKEEVVIDTHVNGLIAAFGDFDSDKFTDVFVISDLGKSLKLLKSHESSPELRLWPNVSCSFSHSDETIVGVMPADYDGDAMMDVLVVTSHEKDLKRSYFQIYVFSGHRNYINCSAQHKPLIKDALRHPMILDYNGDMISDFIIQTDKCKRHLWSYSDNEFKSQCPPSLQPPGNADMSHPHSNAFVNIQNCKQNALDFTTDIFISGKDRMEYWFNKGGFSQENTVFIQYPDTSRFELGQSTFIDLNIDGCIEHVLPVCETHFFRTKCDPQILWFSNNKKEWVSISDFNDSSNQTNVYFHPIESAYKFNLPITLRSGDFDGDGYVDLLTVMTDTNGKTKVVLLKNIKDDSSPSGRKFIYFWSSEKLISEDVELASFLDLQENGKLDIIMTVRDSKGGYNIKFIRNTFMENSCFVKVLVTSGLCTSDGVCPNEKASYGNQPGPFVCYETSNVDGLLIKGCSTQLSQSSHFSLQMPYSVFGLGQTPNFVETVTASIPSGQVQPVRKSRWTQIVPDAQVVLIPYPPNQTVYWISKLFYTPSRIVFSTLITLGAMCAILAIIIGILHRKEVIEDLTEHEEYKRHWPESR